MQYKVVPIDPKFNEQTATSDSKDAADYLNNFINHYIEQGWIYVSVENISVNVAGNSGCFGFGATPGYTALRQMVVFKKDA